MNDPYGKIFAFLASIIMMVFISLTLIFTGIVDPIAKSSANKAVQDFSDKARSTGIITQSDYQQLITKLSAGLYTYQINMQHESKVIVPYEKNDGSTVDGEYRQATRSYGKNEILDTIENGTPYKMKSGDTFSISIVSLNETFGSRIIKVATFGGSSSIKISASAGGIVGSDSQ